MMINMKNKKIRKAFCFIVAGLMTTSIMAGELPAKQNTCAWVKSGEVNYLECIMQDPLKLSSIKLTNNTGNSLALADIQGKPSMALQTGETKEFKFIQDSFFCFAGEDKAFESCPVDAIMFQVITSPINK